MKDLDELLIGYEETMYRHDLVDHIAGRLEQLFQLRATPPMGSEPPPVPVFTGAMDHDFIALSHHPDASMPDWGSQDGYMVDWISDFLGVRNTAPAHTTVQEPSLFFQSGQDQSSPVVHTHPFAQIHHTPPSIFPVREEDQASSSSSGTSGYDPMRDNLCTFDTMTPGAAPVAPPIRRG
ncbi:hypothetical protein PIB30_053228 [Stylosanthes scabra]|uniref:Uncharacterized protein n=1 Tax=Stylosanthes scabra TaxID=79078 RepID=A0ABU6ULB5_9FABA|nr:hypothetical protein [Stylosanthes scabra]